MGAGQLERATQTVPPRIRRAVVKRHRGCCAVPGCTNRAYVHLHHLHARAEGGGHDPELLVPLCSRHHRAVHAGALIVRGRFADGFVFEHADGSAYGSPHARAESSQVMAKVFGALTAMGYRESQARRMVDAVRQREGRSHDLDAVLKAALKEDRLAGSVRESVPVYARVA